MKFKFSPIDDNANQFNVQIISLVTSFQKKKLH